MGQYYYIINLTKEEFLHPHRFDDGLKLMEFGCSARGTMTALVYLLSIGQEGAGGDLCADDGTLQYCGRWAGDQIIIAGDYSNPIPEYSGDLNLFRLASEQFRDISSAVIAEITTLNPDALRREE